MTLYSDLVRSECHVHRTALVTRSRHCLNSSVTIDLYQRHLHVVAIHCTVQKTGFQKPFFQFYLFCKSVCHRLTETIILSWFLHLISFLEPILNSELPPDIMHVKNILQNIAFTAVPPNTAHPFTSSPQHRRTVHVPPQ